MVDHDPHHQLAQGVYQIYNLAGGTVIDVSLDDRRSVKGVWYHTHPGRNTWLNQHPIGYPAHGMLNQQVQSQLLPQAMQFLTIFTASGR